MRDYVLTYLYLLSITCRFARCDMESLIRSRFGQEPVSPKLMHPLDVQCSTDECDYGNFVADAIYYYGRWKLTENRNITSKYPVALFFTSNMKKQVPKGPIDKKVLEESVPKSEKIWSVETTGKNLKHLLRKHYLKKDVIQMSGVHVMFTDNFKDAYYTVRCGHCFEPAYITLKDTQKIDILVNDNGKSNFNNIKDCNFTIIDAVMTYIDVKTTITTATEERYLHLSKDEAFLIKALGKGGIFQLHSILFSTVTVLTLIMTCVQKIIQN